MFGGQTLVELRTALFEAELAEEGGVSPRVSPAIELGAAAALLQRAGFSSPVADCETITVTYPDILALMRDLRGHGRKQRPLPPAAVSLSRATPSPAPASIYAERFAGPDGRLRATFEILFLDWMGTVFRAMQHLAPGRAGGSADMQRPRTVPATESFTSRRDPTSANLPGNRLSHSLDVGLYRLLIAERFPIVAASTAKIQSYRKFRRCSLYRPIAINPRETTNFDTDEPSVQTNGPQYPCHMNCPLHMKMPTRKTRSPSECWREKRHEY